MDLLPHPLHQHLRKKTMADATVIVKIALRIMGIVMVDGITEKTILKVVREVATEVAAE